MPISNCINSNITEIFVLTQYNSASLNRHISRTYRFSTFSTGFVEILAAEQTKESEEWFQGTADAVRQVLMHLKDLNVENLVILSGDHLYRMDYRKFLKRHFETKADVTISVIPCVARDAEGFGLLKTDDDGRIVEFKEKPTGDALESMRVDTTRFGLSEEESAKRPYLASMGIYIFKYKYLVELLKKDKTWIDFGREIIPAAIGEANVQAHLFNNYWEDIGTIRAFYEANLDLARPLPKFNFFNTKAPIYTRSRYLPPSKMHDCEISNSLISEGCILRGVFADGSIIGLRSRIDSGTRIENSIIMGADEFESFKEIQKNSEHGVPHIGIGENCVVRRAIIDKNARIGNDVKLVNRNDVSEEDGADGSYFIRDGIILVPKNAVIKDGMVI